MIDRSKSEQYKDHPLNGIGLKALLKELVDHYGWPILEQQINLNCFRSNPSIVSSYKFLHRTKWAREKVEAFYLYKFMQFPRPTNDQHKYSPREREIDMKRIAETPAVIEIGDSEFFDDPIDGPVFPSKDSVKATREQAKKNRRSKQKESKKDINEPPRVSKDVQRKHSHGSKQVTTDKKRSSNVQSNQKPVQDSPGEAADPWGKWKS